MPTRQENAPDRCVELPLRDHEALSAQAVCPLPRARRGADHESMKALRKTARAPGAELVEIPIPEPKPDQALVRVSATSICGTDLHIYNWDHWAEERIHPPMTFGHEVSGIVEAVGAEVHTVAPGDYVAAETHFFCGSCQACRTGRAHVCERLKILGVDTEGSFADYVVVPARCLWPMAPSVPPEVAAIQEPFGNAVHTTIAGDLATANVAVLGCGPIGLCAIGIARACGAVRIVAVEPNEFRADLAMKMGADRVVDPRSEDAVAAVLEETGGHGAEVVLEMSGVSDVIRSGLAMLAHGGRISLLGLPSEQVTLDLTDQVIFKEATVQGVTGRELFKTWQQTSRLLSSGMVDVTPIITHHFPLTAYEEAFETLRSGRSGKVVMYPQERT
ncbi:MAG: L-threonine 3-dehydrogenase [Actinomycetota bacterium]